MSPAHRPGWVRVLLIAALVVIALAVFVGATAYRVTQSASQDEARATGAIVIFGAAEYAGRPSPVFKARLDHALGLYRAGLAPLIITTGGHGGDPTYTEGGVGRDYLKKRGVADENVIAETQGEDTAHSAARVATILRANGISDCIAVSDAYHLFRIKELMQANGVRAYGSAWPGSVPASRKARAKQAVREALSYFAWKLGVT